MSNKRTSWLSLRCVVYLVVSAVILLGLMVYTGIVTSPFTATKLHRFGDWVQQRTGSADDGCDCMWRISCPKFRWQVNFTSPRYKCGYEQLSDSSINTCLQKRRGVYGRDVRVRLVGHVREAFLTDYLQGRLHATPGEITCQLVKTGPAEKPTDNLELEYYQVKAVDGSETCGMQYHAEGIQLEYKLLRTLGADIFTYVDSLMKQCEQDGCDDDILIISGGTGELLDSTLMDSFSGVRRFQKQYKQLLPRLIELVVQYRMEVVWKIHEPVTDELIPDGSMVRNDLLQEYNALIMEQTMLTPVRVWTSHMIMKLHHIEACSLFTDSDQMNADPWRCEEEWVAGDQCHSDYFDTILNRVCDNMVPMPENPCCSS